MAQVNVDPEFSFNNVFSVESYYDNHNTSEILTDLINDISYRIATAQTSEAFRIETSNLYDNYSNQIFSCDYSVPSYDTDIDFNYLNINLRIRSGQCADISTIQEYFFRAYHIDLSTYIFWSAGAKIFTQEVIGYDPARIENITILLIK